MVLTNVFDNFVQFFINIAVPFVVIFFALLFFIVQGLFILFYRWLFKNIKKRIPFIYEYLDKYLLLSEIREKLLKK